MESSQNFLRKSKKTSDIIDNYLFSLYGKSINTRRTYSSIIKKFSKEMPDTIENIRLEHIENYIICLQKKYKNSSVNLAINVIKSFYKYVAKNNGRDLGKRLQTLDTLPPEHRVITNNEYQKICDCPADKRKIDCFRFLCHTGLRVTEFVNLGPENVAHGFLRVIGKNRRRRSIPLNNTAKLIYSQNPNFEMIRKRNRIWVYRACKELSKKARVAPVNPHACRHYFATQLYHKGVDMATISRLLGHASTAVTELVYVHFSEQSLLNVTDVLDEA